MQTDPIQETFEKIVSALEALDKRIDAVEARTTVLSGQDLMLVKLINRISRDINDLEKADREILDLVKQTVETLTNLSIATTGGPK